MCGFETMADKARVDGEHIFSDGSYTDAVRDRIASIEGLREAFGSWVSLRDEATSTGSQAVSVMAARAWRAVRDMLMSAFSASIGLDAGRIEEMALSAWFRDDVEGRCVAAA